jgi:hypothetical protein
MRFHDDASGQQWVDCGMGWVPSGVGVAKAEAETGDGGGGGGGAGGGDACREVRAIYYPNSDRIVFDRWYKGGVSLRAYVGSVSRDWLSGRIGDAFNGYKKGNDAGWMFVGLKGRVDRGVVADCLKAIASGTATQPSCPSGSYPDSGILRESCPPPNTLVPVDGSPGCFKCSGAYKATPPPPPCPSTYRWDISQRVSCPAGQTMQRAGYVGGPIGDKSCYRCACPQGWTKTGPGAVTFDCAAGERREESGRAADGTYCYRCVNVRPTATASTGPMLGGDGRWYAPDGLGGCVVWNGAGWCRP